ncbi:SprT-like domain-containing protein [Haladaptatus pallidirubidus]|uniref:SprT-like domain-containing protein n=1 Tax=Haladaptatus pallidirubidus TaxID=1008152 RepID=UPI001D10196C|nr:SprT-like domain-containing protein [Haladaptatus pallidirubidus]
MAREPPGRAHSPTAGNPLTFSFVSCQTTLADVIQRTLTKCADTTELAETPTTDRNLLDRAQVHAADVAAEHSSNLPVEAITWKVSHRAKRQAGTKYDPTTEAITIALTWTPDEHHGWEQFSSTVCHELIHAWQYHEFGKADHGATFTRWTDRLNTSQHCERFTTPKWWLVCENCGGRIARYRRSKIVRNPEQYSCGECGGSIHVEEDDGH